MTKPTACGGDSLPTPQPVRTTRIVQILDIRSGPWPFIRTCERLRTSAGGERSFVQEVQVPDGSIFQRLLAQVTVGDTIEAVVVTEFCEQPYRTHLEDFRYPVQGGR